MLIIELNNDSKDFQFRKNELILKFYEQNKLTTLCGEFL